MGKKALITGIAGQDGYFLAELLHGKGYDVYGLSRPSSWNIEQRLGRICAFVKIEHGDVTDSLSLREILQRVQPDEIYNLAAQSHVKVSFEEPEYTANSDALGTLRLLEALRILGLGETSRFYQASTSELYGKVDALWQGLNA